MIDDEMKHLPALDLLPICTYEIGTIVKKYLTSGNTLSKKRHLKAWIYNIFVMYPSLLI